MKCFRLFDKSSKDQIYAGKLVLGRIQSGQQLSDGGDLEEPVEARLLSRVVHIIDRERV